MPDSSAKGSGLRLLLKICGGVAFLITALAVIKDFKDIQAWFEDLTRPSQDQPIDTLTKVRTQRTLSIGFIPYYDMSSRESSGTAVRGFLVDLLHKMAADLDIPVSNIEFHETDWQNFAIGLNQRRYDLSIAGTFDTPERRLVVDFTEPIAFLGSGALVRTNDARLAEVKSIGDLDRPGLTVAVTLGEQGYEYAKNNFKNVTQKAFPGPDLSLPCLEVERGLADVALSDQYILKLYAARHPAVRDVLETKPYRILPICWAVRKGPTERAWLRYLNSRISHLKTTGWLTQLRAEYASIPWAPPPRESGEPAVRLISPGWVVYLRSFLLGIAYTLLVSTGAIFIGTIIGVGLALYLTHGPETLLGRAVLWASRTYVYLFLAIPPLVLVIITYYNGYTSSLGSTSAATVALGLNLSPFVAKIVANGIQNIHGDYLRAAVAFGYGRRQIASKFKFWLTLKTSLQPLLVQYLTTIKLSSLASVIGVTEVLHRSQQVIRETYQTGYAYLALVACFVVIVIPVSLLADRYERLARTGSG